jgi:hypothetical protein
MNANGTCAVVTLAAGHCHVLRATTDQKWSLESAVPKDIERGGYELGEYGGVFADLVIGVSDAIVLGRKDRCTLVWDHATGGVVACMEHAEGKLRRIISLSSTLAHDLLLGIQA